MNEPAQLDLIELFRAFLSHYPSMRFGEAVCAVAAWENDDPTVVSDESLVLALKENLESRFEDNAYDVARSSMSHQLATALREFRRLKPEVPLGRLLAPLVLKNNWNIYDMEDENLILVLQREISALSKTSTHNQPVSA